MAKKVYQLKISLNEIVPAVWRRIVVPEAYSFWDLHVAIQDSMGWLDYHLHAFKIRRKHSRKVIEIGIPDEDGFDEREVLPSWEVTMKDYFREVGTVVEYEYDFGDGWEHEILFEGLLLAEKEKRYPKCMDGERACPPEDCGGVPGYYELLEVLFDPEHEEYENRVMWLGKKYDPDRFEPKKVKFDNPRKRWIEAFRED